jgi:type I restriction-modification system DNA methylase subunit
MFYRKNLRDKLAEYYGLPWTWQEGSIKKGHSRYCKAELSEQGIHIDFVKIWTCLQQSIPSSGIPGSTMYFSRPSKEGFDIVIGNPPYGAKYDNETKRYYKNTYVTANSIRGLQKGSLDTYTLFIELGYNLLRRDGSFAYIVPIWLSTNSPWID